MNTTQQINREAHSSMSTKLVLCFNGVFIVLLSYIGLFIIDVNSPSVLSLAFYYILIMFCFGMFSVLMNDEYAMIFISVVLIGIIATCIIESFPPQSPEKDEVYEAGVIFEDEMFFLQDGKAFATTNTPFERISQIDITDRYERGVLYFGLIHMVAGQERVWGRLFNTLVRGFASLIIYDLLLIVFGNSLQRISFWYCVLSPVLFVWSFNYLKEIPLVLGVAAVINFAARLVKFRFNLGSFILGIVGFGIVGWFRLYNLVPLMFVTVISMVIISMNSNVARCIVGGILVLIVVVIVINKDSIIDTVSGEGVRMYLGGLRLNEAQIEGLGNPIPFMDVIREQVGILRIAGVSFLLALSPVITSVWALTPFGFAGWAGVSIALYAVNWWLLMPFIGKGIIDSFQKRDYWSMGLAVAFVSWFVVSASLRFGIGFDCFRYRDALLPVMVVLAGKGYLSVCLDWKAKKYFWSYVLMLYLVSVGSLVAYRGIKFVL